MRRYIPFASFLGIALLLLSVYQCGKSAGSITVEDKALKHQLDSLHRVAYPHRISIWKRRGACNRGEGEDYLVLHPDHTLEIQSRTEGKSVRVPLSQVLK